jgi:hypothetical protein
MPVLLWHLPVVHFLWMVGRRRTAERKVSSRPSMPGRHLKRPPISGDRGLFVQAQLAPANDGQPSVEISFRAHSADRVAAAKAAFRRVSGGRLPCP